ncbi:MAG: YHS domain-containing protein [Paracoccaceae bacterium]|jgi:YHS domain-containing protein
MPNCRFFLAYLAILLSAVAAPSRADVPIFYAADGAAINGYDTVAYFTDGTPVKGKADYAVMWKGVVWQFSNLQNRETFEADPRSYAPQYGGYCAYAVSRGFRASTAPEAWRIVAGKLYLIHTPVVHQLWARDIDGNIARADVNWPGVLHD